MLFQRLRLGCGLTWTTVLDDVALCGCLAERGTAEDFCGRRLLVTNRKDSRGVWVSVSDCSGT